MSIRSDKRARWDRELYGSKVGPSLGFDGPATTDTQTDLSAAYHSDHKDTLSRFLNNPEEHIDVGKVLPFCAPTKGAGNEDERKAHLDSAVEKAMANGNVAIIGMACRKLGGDITSEKLWKLLQGNRGYARKERRLIYVGSLEEKHMIGLANTQSSLHWTDSMNSRKQWVLDTTPDALEASGVLMEEFHHKKLQLMRPRARNAICVANYLAAAGAAFYESSKSPFRQAVYLHLDDERIKIHDPPAIESLQYLASSILPLFVFTAATSTIYHLNRWHRHQDHFLVGGIALGVLLGMIILRDLQQTTVNVVPWTILGAMIASPLWHEHVWRESKGLCDGGVV